MIRKDCFPYQGRQGRRGEGAVRQETAARQQVAAVCRRWVQRSRILQYSRSLYPPRHVARATCGKVSAELVGRYRSIHDIFPKHRYCRLARMMTVFSLLRLCCYSYRASGVFLSAHVPCVILSQLWSPNDYVQLGFEKYIMIVHKHPSPLLKQNIFSLQCIDDGVVAVTICQLHPNSSFRSIIFVQ